MFYLAAVSTPEADDSPDLTMINERYEVQDSCLRSEGNHARLAVVGSVIDPYQRFFPIELGRKCQ